MEDRRNSKIRVRSQSSEDSSCSFLEPEPTADLDSLEKECISSEWTNEKHSLYLKSMEASFVNQLHSSKGLRGWPPQKAKQSNTFRRLNGDTCRPSGEFKVFQGGCWQIINCGIAEHPNKEDDSSVFSENPWIQHFRSTCKHQVLANQIGQVRAAPISPKIESSGKKMLSSGLATSSNDQDFIGSDTEVSDQNFVGEVIEGNKANRIFTAKRIKTMIVDSSSSDQVVPFSSSLVTTEDTSGNCARTQTSELQLGNRDAIVHIPKPGSHRSRVRM